MSKGALIPLPGSVIHSPRQGVGSETPIAFVPFSKYVEDPAKLSSFTRKDANRGLSCADFREIFGQVLAYLRVGGPAPAGGSRRD